MGAIFKGLLACVAATMLISSAASAEEWITAPGIGKTDKVVLHFRREIELDKVPVSFPVEVSADNRFILYVNGERVGQGPARGDLKHWRYATYDLKSYLKRGHNVLAAEVWNAAGDTSKPGLRGAPMAQITARTGFWVRGTGAAKVVGSDTNWRVSVQPSHTFTSPFAAITRAQLRSFPGSLPGTAMTTMFESGIFSRKYDHSSMR